MSRLETRTKESNMHASVLVVKTKHNRKKLTRNESEKRWQAALQNLGAAAPLAHSEVRPKRVRVEVCMIGPERW